MESRKDDYKKCIHLARREGQVCDWVIEWRKRKGEKLDTSMARAIRAISIIFCRVPACSQNTRVTTQAPSWADPFPFGVSLGRAQGRLEIDVHHYFFLEQTDADGGNPCT